MGLFKDWGLTNIDIRSKVRRKITGKNKLKKRSESADYTGRKYDDYIEFVKPQLFEINTETGEIRSNIFYCDAQMPSQKPHVENNHEFIRYYIKEKIYVKFNTGKA